MLKPAIIGRPFAIAAWTAGSDNDFVFVEPSYAPKNDETEASKAAAEPSARALAAAAKFAAQPDANLLPPASASMQDQAAAAASTAMWRRPR